MNVSVKETVSDALKTAVDFLMPMVCVGCETEGALMCESCLNNASRPPSNVCMKCGERTREFLRLCGDCVALPPPLDRLVPVYRYDGIARSAVHALKYRGITAIASSMAREMWVHPYFRRAKIDCVVPVPMHESRLRERGYNQAAMLACDVAEHLGIRYIENALAKIRATQSQVELSRQERAVSLRNAFDARYDFADAHILLIDDVCTTGSTLMNCAATLKRAGARRVSAVVFAKEMSIADTEEQGL